MRLAGAVLVGGAGRRMGGAKEAVDLAGRPMAAWVVEALRRAGASVVLAVGSPPGWAPPGTVPVRDLRRGAGPLWAVRSAVAASPAAITLVVACDLPHVRPSTLRRLAGAVEAGAALALATADGRALPVLSAVHRRAARELEHLTGAGAERAGALSRVVGATTVPICAGDVVTANRASELAALRSLGTPAWRW